MTEGVTRIRVRLGSLEVEYEGGASFIDDGLKQLVTELIEVYRLNQAIVATPEVAEKPAGYVPPGSGGGLDHSTYAIAALLGAKSGPDLIIAAAANLTLTQGKETFSRQDISNEMKTATAYHKTTYISNLSKYLAQMVKADRLRPKGAKSYSLSFTERKKLEDTLAGK